MRLQSEQRAKREYLIQRGKTASFTRALTHTTYEDINSYVFEEETGGAGVDFGVAK